VAGNLAIVDVLAAVAQKIQNVDSVERIAAKDYGEHLLIRAFSEVSNEKPILLLGHTDTVHPRGSLGSRPLKIENDRVFAPGIFDMKSGIGLAIEILSAFEALALKPRRPLIILLSCDEEIGSLTGRALVEQAAREAAYCLVLEPSAPGGAVKTGRKGTANYMLKAHGIPAHAGLEPERGASAILEIARQIPRIHALNRPEIGTTVNVCTISGGTTTNVIPEEAKCSIDVRFSTIEEGLRIEREIKNLQPSDIRVDLKVTGEINRPPLERNNQVVELFEKARQIAARFDYKLTETQVGGASDGNFVAALGVLVLDGLGVQGDGAHTHHEYILASDVPKRAALVASLILDL
jgi:glutamate carboxypeptidase